MMAILPSSATNIRLLSGIPFHSDYKNTRYFDTRSQQETWFLSRTVVDSGTDYRYQRDKDESYVNVKRPIEELRTVNYMMFQNQSKWYYAFVTRLEYKSVSVTRVHFELDVFQTWWHDCTFKPSYIVREHCPQWDEDGNPVVNTVDEGLDYGRDYETVTVDHLQAYDDLLFLVIVSKATLHQSEDQPANEIVATVNGVPQPLSYYIHPFKKDGTTPPVHVGSSSSGITGIIDALSSIFKQDDAVNNVVSMYVTESIPYIATFNDGAYQFETDYFQRVTISDNENTNITTLYVKDLKGYFTFTLAAGNKYAGFETVEESKLMMYPYMLTVIDDFKGNRLEVKNELIENQNLTLTLKSGLGVSQKTTYQVNDYLQSEFIEGLDRLNTSLEYALINNNPNDVPILSDYLSAYLQGNKNTLEVQKDSILFNGFFNTMNSAVGTATLGAQTGGLLGAAGGAVIGGAQGAGNTVLQMQGIQAKLSDINNTPPSIVKMGSNTNYDFGYEYLGVYVLKKQIRPEYRRKLTDFFKKFGYKVNEVKIPNFHTRERWNYVQTLDCIIQGNLNNEDLNDLKQIFNNGITLWHTNDIGNYDLSNGEV